MKLKANVRNLAVIGVLILVVSKGHAAPEATPVLKSAWKLDLPAGTKRIAVAVVTTDKKPRLLTLDEHDTLTIRKMTASGPVKEDAVALGAAADQFAVGRFAKGRPAVIVIPGALYYWDSGKYARKDVAAIKQVSGMMRFVDGTEFCLIADKSAIPQPYTIDLAAADPLPILIDAVGIPGPDQEPEVYRDISPTMPPAMFAQAPQEIKQGAMMRLFVPEKSKKLYGLVAWQAETAHLAIISDKDISAQPTANIKPLWKSPKLAGKILDIAFGASIKDAKQSGVYVLEASGDDGKGRQLEFFTLE